MGEIYIHPPFIEERENGLSRLIAKIDVNGEEKTAFVEVENAYKDYLVTERSDAFVFLTVPIAVREGYDIRCEVPISEMLQHNIEEILVPAIVKGDTRAKKIKINVPIEKEAIETKGGVATAVSCGVDSTHTIMQYTQDKYNVLKLTHLFVASVSLDLWDFYSTDDLVSWERKNSLRFKRYYEVSRYTGLPIVKAFTNFVPFITDKATVNPTYKHIANHGYITMSTVLSLAKLFGVYIFSGAYDLSEFTMKDNLSNATGHYELLLTSVLNRPGFVCFTGGVSLSRAEKTLDLVEYPLARKTLHPCFRNTVMNCSEPGCSKCIRGLLTLDCYDKLDAMSEVFDIERYRKNHKEYLVELIKFKDEPHYDEIYDIMLKKYPNKMEEAQKAYNKSITPVERETYNTLNKAYNTALLMLSDAIPKKTVMEWVATNNIKKLYWVGESNLGGKIKEFICNDVEIVTYKNGNVNDCDAVFISDINNDKIAYKKKLVRKKLDKDMKMYTINDIIKIFSTK